MKLKSTFLVHKYGEENLLIPTAGEAFSGIVKGNDTLGEILNLLREETTEEAMTDAILLKFDAPRDVVERDVKKAVEELRKIGALDE
ncbi:MAG: PqqD family protein [Clostridiales bacterium]|nr:PqqD family protein [Clostridiales bacterium]